MNELVTFQLGALYKSLATFRAHVDPWPVGVKVFTHGGIVTKHFRATLVWTRYCPGNLLPALTFGLDPANGKL